VHITTQLSTAVAGRLNVLEGSSQFHYEPAEEEEEEEEVPRKRSNKSKKSPDRDFGSKLTDILNLPIISELRSLLHSGLLPFSMASEFGEEELKRACASPLFWWRLVAPAASATCRANCCTVRNFLWASWVRDLILTSILILFSLLMPPRTIFSFTGSLFCLCKLFRCTLHACLLSVDAMLAQGTSHTRHTSTSHCAIANKQSRVAFSTVCAYIY
jgi:hypothetical protein